MEWSGVGGGNRSGSGVVCKVSCREVCLCDCSRDPVVTEAAIIAACAVSFLGVRIHNDKVGACTVFLIWTHRFQGASAVMVDPHTAWKTSRNPIISVHIYEIRFTIATARWLRDIGTRHFSRVPSSGRYILFVKRRVQREGKSRYKDPHPPAGLSTLSLSSPHHQT